jgi:hypothetical protein
VIKQVDDLILATTLELIQGSIDRASKRLGRRRCA